MSDNLKCFHLPIDESLWHSRRKWRITICCAFGTLIFGCFTLVDQLPILIEECAQGDWSDGIGHCSPMRFMNSQSGLVQELHKIFSARTLLSLK